MPFPSPFSPLSPKLLAAMLLSCLSPNSIVLTAQLPVSTTVPEMVREAVSNNPELKFYEAELKAAQASRRTAGRLAQPEANAAVGQKHARDNANQLQGEGTAWSVSVTQSFEWPGRIGLRKAIANHDVLVAELGLARFKSALAARVLGRAYSLSSAEQKQRVAEEVAARYRSLRDVLIQRDSSGIAPQLELRILDATELGLRRRASEAMTAAEESRLELNHLLGRPGISNLVVATPNELHWKSPHPIEALLGAALTNNFDLRIRLAELEQQGFRVRLARNERWPGFKVGPQFSEENAGGQDRILGIGLSFPLPLWKQNSSNVELAQARQSQAESLLNSQRRDLEKRIISAARKYESRLAELQRWNPDSLNHFAEAAELADRHYRLAAVPATLYTELQKQYVDAMESLLDTRMDVIAAAAELEELTGLPTLPTP
jgi:cobalt-zinc-cadmium efflux system outer membrane protein